MHYVGLAYFTPDRFAGAEPRGGQGAGQASAGAGRADARDRQGAVSASLGDPEHLAHAAPAQWHDPRERRAYAEAKEVVWRIVHHRKPTPMREALRIAAMHPAANLGRTSAGRWSSSRCCFTCRAEARDDGPRGPPVRPRDRPPTLASRRHRRDDPASPATAWSRHGIPQPLLAPVIALVIWTAVMWRPGCTPARIPAILRLRIAVGRPTCRAASRWPTLPAVVRWKADNYNRLFEQLVLFYATALALAVHGDASTASLAAGLGLCRPARHCTVCGRRWSTVSRCASPCSRHPRWCCSRWSRARRCRSSEQGRVAMSTAAGCCIALASAQGEPRRDRAVVAQRLARIARFLEADQVVGRAPVQHDVVDEVG